MKKLLSLAFLCLILCACEVRHNHRKQMMQVHVAVDHANTKKDTASNSNKDWQNEPLIETPDMVDDDVEMTDEEALEELERMMQGSAE